MKKEDCLVEILTEELPPKSLLKLATHFAAEIEKNLQKSEFTFDEIKCFATPRRLAVLIKSLSARQPDQVIERRGPSLKAAFDANGKPTKACLGFAQSLNVTPEDLLTLSTEKGQWVGFKEECPGQAIQTILPQIVENAAMALPIPKRMRWGESSTLFVRPVIAVVMLYGDEVIAGEILGVSTGRATKGHRFLSTDWITLPHADAYESLLATEGMVQVDFISRRNCILSQIKSVLAESAPQHEAWVSSDAFLNEVTALVEWPHALCGRFDAKFLALPPEVLISVMEDHQRYFPVKDEQGKLAPYFVVISNIVSQDEKRVIHGNERVLRARLEDAAFFFEADKKIKLADRIEKLKHIVYQAKLGTLYDKTARIQALAKSIADKLNLPVQIVERAALLAKTDLTTDMVNEFPELQGIMGYYYAQADGEKNEVAIAIKEHYLPRFAKDALPNESVGQVVALADKLDNLLGLFATNQVPTGDKDPFGARRAGLGVIRILVEKQIQLNLSEILSTQSLQLYPPSKAITENILSFLQERMRAWYLEQGVLADVFAAVAALGTHNPYDTDRRIKAVMRFRQLSEAEALSVANKRVSNILEKYDEENQIKEINPALFETKEENELDRLLEAYQVKLSKSDDYENILINLAALRTPIDNFFDHVMVMTEDKAKRENRILLLKKLRDLFLQVADIALLQ